MKEKIKIKTIVCCLMMTSMLLGLGACNNEDDVMEIPTDVGEQISITGSQYQTGFACVLGNISYLCTPDRSG